MKKINGLFLALSLIAVLGMRSYAQTRTITSAGLWSNTGIWTGGAIADALGEDAVMNNNLGTITVDGNYTIGNLTMNNGNTLTINSGFTMNLGNSTNSRDLTSGNTADVNISGTLIIWGDVNIGNSLDLTVASGGTLIIKGNVNMGNGGDLVIAGNVQIDGNFVGGNDTDLIVDGTVTIGGNLTVGNNSDPSGTGTVTVGGTCSDGTSNFCGVGPLPVELIFFSGVENITAVDLSWATAVEINFNYFILQKSVNGVDFIDLDTIQGGGNSRERRDYSYKDSSPYVGRNYYRLREVDYDLASRTFDVIKVVFNGNRKISVYPNPIQDYHVNIELNFQPGEDGTITVTSQYGVEVYRGKANDLHQKVSISQALAAGVYFVKYTSSDFSSVTRILLK